MKNNELLPMLEAVLFAVGEPIESEKISHALGIDLIVIEQALSELQNRYDQTSGL